MIGTQIRNIQAKSQEFLDAIKASTNGLTAEEIDEVEDILAKIEGTLLNLINHESQLWQAIIRKAETSRRRRINRQIAQAADVGDEHMITYLQDQL